MASDPTRVAVACQGGGSHTAFTAGVLSRLVRDLDDGYEITGFSGTSGGAICALLTWYGLAESGDELAVSLLESFWDDLAARSPADAVVNNLTVWGSRVGSSGLPMPQFSPYATPLAAWGRDRLRDAIESRVDFEHLPDLATDAPRLIVSTIDVNGGEFETFEGAAITPEAILASTAVPDLFEAVEIDGHWHWDGLFAQNPPIDEFLHAPIEEKPDEIWIVQINPTEREGEPQSLEEIVDRRNELAGNISMTQAVRFIETVNDWIDAGHLPRDRYQPVAIRRIAFGRDLHCSTKLNRRPSFLQNLINRGDERAGAFLADLG